MPKIMKGFKFKSTNERNTYDWDTLMDGKARFLPGLPDDGEGEATGYTPEYTCRKATFKYLANRQCELRGLKLLANSYTWQGDDGDEYPEGTTGLVIQAMPGAANGVSQEGETKPRTKK